MEDIGSVSLPSQAEEIEEGKKGVPYGEITVGVVKESTPGERRCARSL